MGREHKLNLSEQVRAHHAIVVSDLERAAAFAVAGERVGKLPRGTELPPSDMLVRFGDDKAFSETWEQFSSYCARYSLLAMLTACEYYLGQLLFVAMLAEKVLEKGQVVPAEEMWEIAAKGQKKLYRSPTQTVRDTLSILKQDWQDVAGMAWFESLYRLRNCLVHRKGQVGVEDVGPEGHLAVIWRRITLKVGEELVTCLPHSFEKGEHLSAEFEDGLRTWNVGETIELSASDCQEIAFSLVLFSIQVSDQVHAGLRKFVPLGP